MKKRVVIRGVAATIAVLMILGACSGSDTSTGAGGDASPADQAAPPTTTGSTPETASADDSVSETAQAVEIATEFFEARDQRDSDSMLLLLSPDATILDFGFWPRTPTEYPALLEWMAIFDWDTMLDECTQLAAGPPTRVLCTHRMENAWSRAQGSDPVPGEIEFLVDDGLIVEVVSDTGNWRPVFVRQMDWLAQFHGDQISVMYRFDDEGNLTGGPATTPQALELFRQYLPEYLEWEAAKSES